MTGMMTRFTHPEASEPKVSQPSDNSQVDEKDPFVNPSSYFFIVVLCYLLIAVLRIDGGVVEKRSRGFPNK